MEAEKRISQIQQTMGKVPSNSFYYSICSVIFVSIGDIVANIKPGKFITNPLCCTRHQKIQVHGVDPALLKTFKLNSVDQIIILKTTAYYTDTVVYR
jgi:hypothetical protein